MEIALLSKTSLRIKSKHASFAVDPIDKSEYAAALLLNKSVDEVTTKDTVLINGQGEYEIGGVKITGMRVDSDMIYSIHADGVNILLGNLSALDKTHSKLQEHNIVIANCTESKNASFITSLGENVIIFYGQKAEEVAMGFGKESVKAVNKYSLTKDKLPAEVETILLQ